VLKNVVSSLESYYNFYTYLAYIRVFNLLIYTNLHTARSSASLILPPLLLLPRTALVTLLLQVYVSN
jgi:hypothetical protein